MPNSTTAAVNGCATAVRAISEIEADLRAFEEQERLRLGLEAAPEPWRDPDVIPFTEEQRASTTILFGGLTRMHEALLESTFQRFGYRAKALDCPIRRPCSGARNSAIAGSATLLTSRLATC